MADDGGDSGGGYMNMPSIASNYMPEMPVLPSFGLWSNLTDEQLKEKFDELDVDKSGKLSKDEIRTALKDLGKSEGEIETEINKITTEEIGFEEFKQMATGGAGGGGYMPSMPGMAMPGMPGMPSFGLWSNMTDEQLKAKFAEIDVDNSGKLSKDEIRTALQQLGRSDEEVEVEIGRMKKEEIEFEDFRLMAKPPQQASMIHSVPGVGAVTCALSTSFYGNMSDDELRDAFKKIDVDGSGKLNKKEIADALRQLGKPERAVQNIVEKVPDDRELDFDAFKEIVKPQGIMPSLPSLGAEWTDEQLKQKFEEFDKDGSGFLSKDEMKCALKQLGRTDEEIESEMKRMKSLARTNKDKKIGFEEFRLMAKPPQQASVIHSVPGLGALTCALSDSYYGEMSENQLKDAFNKIDADCSGKLNKQELELAMKQLGKPQRKIDELLGSMSDTEELDFEGFKELIKPKGFMPAMPNPFSVCARARPAG